MENKFPYRIIFHTSETDMIGTNPSIQGSETSDTEPSEESLNQKMEEYNSTYCEVYYDKHDDECYDELLFTLNFVY